MSAENVSGLSHMGSRNSLNGSYVVSEGPTERLFYFPIYESGAGMKIENLVALTNSFMERYSRLIKKNGGLDVIFFLDKSARPLAYLFRKLHQDYLPETTVPPIRFLNINGRSHSVPEDQFQFINDPGAVVETYGNYLPTLSSILVIDELKDSGSTMVKAKKIFQKAFAEASVQTLTAYNVVPKWAAHNAHKGVADFKKRNDYAEIGLKILNSRTGKSDNIETIRDPKDPMKYQPELEQVLDEIVGRIPYSRPLPRNQRGILRYARKELAVIADEVKKYRRLSEQEKIDYIMRCQT